MGTRLFSKPVENDEKGLQKLKEEIFRTTKEYESIEASFETKKTSLESEYSTRKSNLIAEIDSLEETLKSKRQERSNLERPITERVSDLDKREKNLDIRETNLNKFEASISDRELIVEQSTSDVQDLIDSTHEKSIGLLSTERMLKIRDNGIIERENKYLLQIEEFSKERSDRENELSKREKQIGIRELNIKSKEENLSQREKELLNEEKRVNDKIRTLERSEDRIRKQKNESTTNN